MTEVHKSSMKHRFEGEEGKRLLLTALLAQKAASGNPDIALALSDKTELFDVYEGEMLIREDSTDNWVFLILTGSFSILVKGKQIATRTVNDHVGEMAAIDPSQRRTATVVALEDSVVCRLSEPALAELAKEYPDIWRNLGIELSRRLAQRNNLVDSVNEQIRVFVISSAEALPIAQEIQSILSHAKDILLTVWTDGVFKASNYPIESLEAALKESDFAIAIAQPDDVTESRGNESPTARDNVIFELGFFMGHLGRKRALLLEPRGETMKLPSDLSGLTSIGYRTGPVKDMPALLAPTCHAILKLINELGPRE